MTTEERKEKVLEIADDIKWLKAEIEVKEILIHYFMDKLKRDLLQNDFKIFYADYKKIRDLAK